MITDDFINPDWQNTRRVHDWRNYINDKLRAIWHTFTDDQKQVIAENADEQADAEQWD